MVKSMNTKRSKSVVPSVSWSSELKIPIDLPSVNMKDFLSNWFQVLLTTLNIKVEQKNRIELY